MKNIAKEKYSEMRKRNIEKHSAVRQVYDFWSLSSKRNNNLVQ